MFTGDLEIQSMRTETWFFWRTTWLKINMCLLSKKHTSVCVLLLLLSSSLIPLDFQNIVICCWKMSRTAKIVSIEPPDPISDPRVEEILMEMNVEVMSANKKAIRSIHKWSIQLYYLCCIIGGMCFIPREKFLTKRDIRRQSLGILSKDIILFYKSKIPEKFSIPYPS